MKSYKRYTCLLFFLCLVLSVAGRTKTFRGLTMSDGLSDLLVNVIYKDSVGFVWLGTDHSLDRFDGVNIKSFAFEGVDVKRKRVNALVESDLQHLWIGNGAGLWALNRVDGKISRVLPNLLDMPIWSMVYADDLLYIGSEKGLYIADLSAFGKTGNVSDIQLKHVLVDSNVLSSVNRIKKLLTDESGIVWLATSKGLYSYTPESERIQSYVMSGTIPRENEYRAMACIERTLYIGTESQGIFCFDMDEKTFERFIDVGSGVISSLSTDGKERLYVATDGNGVCCVSHSERRILYAYRHDAKDKGSIRSNSVYSLLVDREGIIWVGFYSAGLDYSLYQNDLFDVYSFAPHFDSNNLPVRSFYINGPEKIIGTRDGLYYINEQTGLVRMFNMPHLRSNLILSVGFYQGKYYIGTYGGGLSVFDPKGLILSDFQADDSFTFRKGHIFCLSPDPNGNLWIGTSEGVYRYAGGGRKPDFYNSANSQMPEGNVYEIFFDSSGKGWICTDMGLCIYDTSSGSIKSNVFPDNFPAKEKFRMVYEDASGKLHFLPDKGAVFVTSLSMSSFYRLPIDSDKFHGNAYKSIIEDDEGFLWLGCDDGLLRIEPQGENVTTFGFNDGLPGQTFMDNAIYKDEKGDIWFGNAKGLVFVTPGKVDSILKVPYGLVFTDVFLNGQSVDAKRRLDILENKTLSIDKGENNITFRFVNLSYGDPLRQTYEYKLDEADGKWNFLSGNNEVSYYDIAPGRHVFKVRVPGDETSEISIYMIVRETYTAWIWGAAFVLFMFITLAVFRQRKKNGSVGGTADAPTSERAVPESGAQIPKSDSQISKSDNQISETDTVLPKSATSEEKYKSNRLSPDECKDLYGKFIKYMDAEKPYTNPDLKISDIAQALGVSSPLLSFLFNQYLRRSYYDCVNEYRVAEFKRLVAEPEYARYTLSALAERCGFSSRASFFRSFKKITGITPNEYINSI